MTSSFTMRPLPPFNLEHTVWALRRRFHNVIDQWDGQCYRRVFVINKLPILVSIYQKWNKTSTRLIVSTEPTIDTEKMNMISSLIEKIFGLSRDLGPFYKMAFNDAHLKSLAIKFMGVKPVRFVSIFESLINAIACQQLSLDVGIILLNRFSEKFGAKYHQQNNIYYAFPTPDRIQNCSINELRSLSFSIKKSSAIIALAYFFYKNPGFPETLKTKTNIEVVNILSAFKGIGRWSSEYTLLRGLGRINIFPGDDVGALNNLRKILHLSGDLDYKKITQITHRWHPYEGLVYYHFLLNKLSEMGYIKSNQ